MEKFGVEMSGLRLSLGNEEANLMQKMAALMATNEKTAAQAQEMTQLESRLQEVRAKITEIDLGGGA